MTTAHRSPGRWLRGRRALLTAVVTALAAGPWSLPMAQPAPWPAARPITLVVPYPAGGGTDALARALAEKLQGRLNQTVLVDNRAGGNTLVATKHVMAQPADGYTFYVTPSQTNQMPLLFPKEFNYDGVKDFTQITLLTIAPLILVINANLPAKTLQEFVALAKSKPGQLNVAVTGIGATDHLAAELLATKAGVKFNYVPYKGGAQAIQDVVAGNADARVDVITTSKPHVDTGKLRLLAVMGARTSLLPEAIPAGDVYPGVYGEGFFGLMAPKGLPAPIVARMNKEVGEIMNLPDIQTRIRSFGQEPKPTTPEFWRDMVQKDTDTWREVIKAANLKIE